MKLREMVETSDLSVDSNFKEMLRSLVWTLRLTESEVGSALRVSSPTITRWINGVTAPHPALRESIRKYALRKLNEMREAVS